MSRLTRITTQITAEQLRDMKALAKLDRRPRTALIRDALDDYLVKRRHEIPVEGPDPRQTALRLVGTDS